MARKSADGINRSEEIRKVLGQKPKAKPREVVDELAAKGIKVGYALVYMVKSQLKKKSRRQKRDEATASSRAMGISNPVELILKVRALAVEVGGMKRLKQLVEILAE